MMKYGTYEETSRLLENDLSVLETNKSESTYRFTCMIHLMDSSVSFLSPHSEKGHDPFRYRNRWLACGRFMLCEDVSKYSCACCSSTTKVVAPNVCQIPWMWVGSECLDGVGGCYRSVDRIVYRIVNVRPVSCIYKQVPDWKLFDARLVQYVFQMQVVSYGWRRGWSAWGNPEATLIPYLKSGPVISENVQCSCTFIPSRLHILWVLDWC